MNLEMNNIDSSIARAITNKVNADHPHLKMGDYVKHGGYNLDDGAYNVETQNGNFKISEEAVKDFDHMNTKVDYSKTMAGTYSAKKTP
jgi:hypothetical protein